MGTIRIPVTVCDVCGEDKPTRRWKILFPDEGMATLDLCKKDETPLAEMRRKARIRPGAKGPRRRVVSEAQVRKARTAKKPASSRRQASSRARKASA